MPSSPLSTLTHVLVVQHPLESAHKLNTASVLTRSLAQADLIIARRLPPDFQHGSLSPGSPTYSLFPPSSSCPAVTLSQLREQLYALGGGGSPARNVVGSSAPSVNLIVFDATWKHAKEMVSASEEYLKRNTTRVCLDGFDAEADGGSIFDSELILRKEPCAGCVSTAEAVARWLAVMEKDTPEIAEQLLEVLREMVRLQAQFIKPMKPRPKLLKKNKRQTQSVTSQEDARPTTST
jgi:DTW domain-containing protein YfiP